MTRVPTVRHTTIWFPAPAFFGPWLWVWLWGRCQGPGNRPQWNFSQLSSYGKVYFLSGATLTAWLSGLSKLCVRACVLTILPIHSQRIDQILRHLRDMINTVFTPTDRCIIAYGAVMKVWPVRQEEFMIWVLFVFKDALFLCLCD